MKICSKCGKEERITFTSGKSHSWCKKCSNERQKEYYRKNRERVLEQSKEWQKNNIGKVKASRKKTQWKLKVTTLEAYGGVCACCGEDEYKFLAIDHINNDGAKHRRELKMTGGAGGFYYWLKKNKYPEGFQVLCHNCNMAKSMYNQCPHANV